MSLKTRLRLFVILLMVSVVSALSALYVDNFASASFPDVLQRAERSGQFVKNYLQQRLDELTRDHQPPPRTLEDTRQLWTEFIRTDQDLADFLTNSGYPKEVVEVLIADTEGRILADSVPGRTGKITEAVPDFKDWVDKSTWAKLAEIFTQRQDYAVIVPLGVRGRTETLFTIRLVLSSVMLRRILTPHIQKIVLVFLAALLASMLLAVAVSNLVLRPLHNISQAIDRISRGDFAKAPHLADSGVAKEYAAVQSKLTLLGQQYHGARQDAIQLRTNVEQLLEKLEEVVFLFDKEDRLVMAGRAAERLLGRGRWEIMGRTLTDLFPPSSTLGAAVRNAIELRQPLKDLPLTLERNGAAPTRILVNVEMLEAFPDHLRIGTLITLRDAETRRQIQSQLDISARLAAISRLTSGVAHEIKNPLQAITVHLEVLKSKLSDEFDVVAPEIETIAREIQRLDRVVKTFLDFTRPIDLRMRELEMVSLAGEVVALVGPSAARQNVGITVTSDPEQVFVQGDRDLIQQALLNVVVNGVEAMKQGGKLQIGVERIGEECCLSVADEGVGIPPEIRDKIFNLYFSTKGKGSGIGLAMTFRVVQLHNGTIDFTSEPGKGTTFRLRFPAMEKQPASGAYSATGSEPAR